MKDGKKSHFKQIGTWRYYSINSGSGNDKIIYGYSTSLNHKESDCHSAIEISMFNKSEGVYTINGRDIEFRSGDIFVMPSNAIHVFSKIKKQGEFFNLHFEPRFIWRNLGTIGGDDYLSIFQGVDENFQCRLDRDNPAIAEITELFLKIHREFEEQNPAYSHMVMIYIQLILISIYRNFDYHKKAKETVQDYNIAAIGKSIDYIDARFTEQLKLEDIAAIANLSPTYYGIIFKRLNGITPWEYITSKRIELATQKLKSGDHSTMIELAYACGFNNTANFNRTFRKYTGQTPTEYKILTRY